MVFAIFFRFYNYNEFSLSNDELSAVIRLNFNSLSEVIDNGIRPDGHPAGAEILLYFWTKYFGLTVSSIRFPFVLISCFAPLFAFLFMKRLFGYSPALFLAAAIAFLEFPILYSQIARPYGIGLTFVLMATYFWAELIFVNHNSKSKKILLAFLLSVSWALSLYTHYFASLTVVIIGITGLFYLNKSIIKYYLASGIGSIILFIPHLQITMHQLSLGGVGQWLGAPDNLWIWHHIIYIFNNSIYLFAFLIAIISAIYILNFKIKFRFSSLQFVLITWFLLPFLIGFLYSKFINPVLQNSVLIFSMPFFLAFIFSFIPKNFSTSNSVVFILLFTTISADTFLFEKYYQKQHFAEFKAITEILNDWQNKFKNQKILNLANVNTLEYFKFYEKSFGKEINFSGSSYKSNADLWKLKSILDTTTADYISFSDLQNNSSSMTLSIIESKFPDIIYEKHFADISSIYLFNRHSIKNDSINFINNNSLNINENIYSNDEYYCPSKIKLPKFSKKTLEIYCRYNFESSADTSACHLVVDIQDVNGNSKLWQSLPLKYISSKNIKNEALFHKFIEMKMNHNWVKIYIWNSKKEFIKAQKINIFIGLKDR